MFDWFWTLVYRAMRSIFADRIEKEIDAKVWKLVDQRVDGARTFCLGVVIANEEMKKELNALKQSEVGALREENQHLKKQIADTGNTYVFASLLLKREMELMNELESIKKKKAEGTNE